MTHPLGDVEHIHARQMSRIHEKIEWAKSYIATHDVRGIIERDKCVLLSAYRWRTPFHRWSHQLFKTRPTNIMVIWQGLEQWWGITAAGEPVELCICPVKGSDGQLIVGYNLRKRRRVHYRLTWCMRHIGELNGEELDLIEANLIRMQRILAVA